MGITAQAKPEPMMKIVKWYEEARTRAASSSTPYQPIMTVSVSPTANCAR